MNQTTNDMKKNLARTIAAAFTEHPREAGESYWQHLMFTVGMACRLAVVSVLLIGHGIFPFALTHAASNRLMKCQRILTDRAQRTGVDEMSGGIGI